MVSETLLKSGLEIKLADQVVHSRIVKEEYGRINLGRNSVRMEKFGGRVTAPMKRTTFGCRNLNIISIYRNKIKTLIV